MNKNNKPSKSNKVYKKDIKNGNLNEMKVLKYLNSNGYNLNKDSNRYALFDFWSQDCIAELKSRNNYYNTYPTTMVGMNKIDYAEKLLYDISESVLVPPTVIFLFLFKDGLYKWEMKPEQYTIDKGVRNDRGAYESKSHAFIDIKYLELITKDINSYN